MTIEPQEIAIIVEVSDDEEPRLPAPASTPGPSLTLRASLAAHNRALYAGPAVNDPAWRDRAAHLTRMLCAILGVDPASVHAMPDPDRAYEAFGYRDIRFIVADTLLATDNPTAPYGFTEPATREHDDGEYQFIAGPSVERTPVFLLLRACPECGQLVATYRIASLADLGQIILAERADPPPRLTPDARQYGTDVAHRPGCTQRRPAYR